MDANWGLTDVVHKHQMIHIARTTTEYGEVDVMGCKVLGCPRLVADYPVGKCDDDLQENLGRS